MPDSRFCLNMAVYPVFCQPEEMNGIGVGKTPQKER